MVPLSQTGSCRSKVFRRREDNLAIKCGFLTTLADGSRKAVPTIGPLRIHFAGRYCDLSALVMGDEPLFGAVLMEMMDLVLHPASQTLTVNPAIPYMPVALSK